MKIVLNFSVFFSAGEGGEVGEGIMTTMMMKKRVASSSALTTTTARRHRHLGSRRHLLISLLALICFLALISLNSQFNLQSPTPPRILNLHFDGPPKIAFLFLARTNLPLDFLWHSFFQNADVGNFSIYIHSKPGFVFDKLATRSAFFYGRQLTNAIQVGWGKPSMIEAERLLFGAALDDPANQLFVLLSDSCIPLFNFSFIYNYLMSSPRSFVDSFPDAKGERYDPKMAPVIPQDKWRKGSQWITLVRRHAELVADDTVVFPVFKKLCKSRPPLDLSKGKASLKLQEQHNCIPDEHYVATLLTMRGLEGEWERRTVTYSSWNQSADKMDTNGWHPITFNYGKASPEHIKEIKEIDHVYFTTENRTAWCSTGGRSAPCYLFARKFSRGAAMRLLSNGVVGPYNATALLEKST